MKSRTAMYISASRGDNALQEMRLGKSGNDIRKERSWQAVPGKATYLTAGTLVQSEQACAVLHEPPP